MFIKCYFVSPSFDCCFCYGTIYICQQLTCFSNNSVLNKSHEAPKIFCLSHKLLFCSVMVTIIVYMLKCCFPFSVFSAGLYVAKGIISACMSQCSYVAGFCCEICGILFSWGYEEDALCKPALTHTFCKGGVFLLPPTEHLSKNDFMSHYKMNL